MILNFKFQIILMFYTLLSLSTPTYGANVTKKLKKKSVIQIDAGKSDGFRPKSKVCFFSKKGKKVGCGKVRRAKKSSAFVKVKRKAFKKIRKGFSAELADGQMSASKGSGKTSSAASFATRGFFGGSLFHPGGTAVPIYDAKNASSGSSYWVEGEERKGMGAFIGAEFDYIPLGLVGGFRYFLLQDNWQVEMNYTNENNNPYVFLEGSFASSLGFWLDYLYPLSSGSIGFYVGAGLDIDMTTTQNKAIQKDDDASKSSNAVLVESQSALTTIGIRLPVRMDYDLGGVTLNIGGVFSYGISGEPVTDYKVESADPNIDGTQPQKDKYDQDYEAASAHKPGMGLMGYLGAHIEF